jgi:hypothetical protein
MQQIQKNLLLLRKLTLQRLKLCLETTRLLSNSWKRVGRLGRNQRDMEIGSAKGAA